MSHPSQTDLEAWEDEGGAAHGPPEIAIRLRGTPAQLEWADRIRRQVSLEFDRVAAAFRSVAWKQDADKRSATEAIIAILEEKRVEVMRRDQAGYFIHDWQ